MDAQQFDRLTLHLTLALSRRRFGAVIAALGAGAVAGFDEFATAKQKPKKGKKKKKPGSQPEQTCAEATNGQLPDRCGGVCTNIRFDRANCGGCGIRCGLRNGIPDGCFDGVCDPV